MERREDRRSVATLDEAIIRLENFLDKFDADNYPNHAVERRLNQLLRNDYRLRKWKTVSTMQSTPLK